MKSSAPHGVERVLQRLKRLLDRDQRARAVGEQEERRLANAEARVPVVRRDEAPRERRLGLANHHLDDGEAALAVAFLDRAQVALLEPAHMNKKIKQAQHDKVPFMLIAGDREAADGTVAVRRRDTREQEVVPFEQFLELIRRLRATRALDLGQPLVKN